MNTLLLADGLAADNAILGCTASVLVLSGVKPERKTMILNLYVLSVVNNLYKHFMSMRN